MLKISHERRFRKNKKQAGFLKKNIEYKVNIIIGTECLLYEQKGGVYMS